MSHGTKQRSPLGVIPPYILNRIIEHGSEPQKKCARQTLVHVNTLMAEAYAKPKGVKTAKGGQVERDIYDAQNGTRLPGKSPRVKTAPASTSVMP